MRICKTISILLAVILAASAVSCGSTSGNDLQDASDTSASDTGTETTIDELAPPELPDANYDGYEFKILTRIEGWGIYNNEHLVVEEANGEILNDAIYERNRRVEDRFNVNITEIVTTGDISNEISKTVMAGEDSYDLVVSTYDLKYGTEYLVDFFTLDYINLDRPWWNQNYVEAISIKGQLCSMVNSIMITHMDSVLAMFFNKSLTENYNLPDIYQLVRDGKWTLPKFFEITKNVTTDLNGDSAYDDNDLYAFVGLDGIKRLGSGAELKTVVKDSNDIPTLNFSDAKLLDSISRLRDYASQYEVDIYNPRTDRNTGGDGDRAVFRLFLNDQAMFYVHGLGSAQMFRDMQSDFGIIPTPKLDDSQETYFISPDKTKSLVIPASASDLDRTAIIMEALAYEGYTYVRPLYYETMLQSKYLRDEESVEMMDEYIYTNIGFAPRHGSTTLNNTVDSILIGTSEIASALAEKQSAIQGEIDKYVEMFE